MPEFMRQINGNGHRPEADSPRPVAAIPPHAGEAHATPRPDSIDEYYAESQTEEGVKEQKEAYEENAEKEAATPERTAAELAHRARKAVAASDRQDALAEGESKRFEVRLAVLGPYARRRQDAAFVYWLAGLLLIVGDVAGASGAILLLGEQVFNAIAQATSVAVSAVILGSVGTQVRHWMAAKARQKPPGELTEKEEACDPFFTGPDSFVAIKVLVMVFIAGVVPIVVGIFTLRQAAEGREVAIAFGCFALALCMASFIRSYDYACEVSDYLKIANTWRRKLDREAGVASAVRVIASYDAARAEVDSIRARNKAAGAAAGHGLRREMYERFQRRPEIFGHGTAPGKVGRRKGGRSAQGPKADS